MLNAITMLFWIGAFAPWLRPSAAIIGVPARIPVMHSNISERPEPFGPPSGSTVVAWRASVVGLPWTSIAAPSGIGLPSAAAWRMRPAAIRPVAMSSNSGLPSGSGAGIPIAIGLVAMLGTLAPWYAI